MGTLGEDLKAAREKKGLTLRQVSEKTRIGQTFLKALEDEDYPVIPGDIFVVGFLRNYAKEIGLDEDEVAARYKEQQRPRLEAIQAQGPAEPEPMSAAMMAGTTPLGKKTPIYIVLLAGLLLGALLMAVTLYMTRAKKPNAVSPPRPVPAAMPLKPVTTVAPTHENMSSVQPRVEGNPAPKAALHLKLTAEAACWYWYRADKGGGKSGLLEKGQVILVQADKRITLSLGNAGGVKAELNGKALKPFGAKGETLKGIVFTGELEGAVMPRKKPSGNRALSGPPIGTKDEAATGIASASEPEDAASPKKKVSAEGSNNLRIKPPMGVP